MELTIGMPTVRPPVLLHLLDPDHATPWQEEKVHDENSITCQHP